MFQFTREKVLPLFLKTGLGIKKFAHHAGISAASALRAVNGQPVSAPIINKVAAALGIEPLDFLVKPKP